MQRHVWAAGFFALVALLAGPQKASAQPMTFIDTRDTSGVAWGQGVRDYIFGDGEITSATPAALTDALAKYHAHPGTILVLNSPGGEVSPALAMGHIIRNNRLWTMVGARIPLALGLNPNLAPTDFPYIQRPTAPPFPGFCYSSCTLAFLGGVVRSVDIASDYGVR